MDLTNLNILNQVKWIDDFETESDDVSENCVKKKNYKFFFKYL